jgi:hypothetical protein
MKTLLIALFAACACASLHAQTFTWQPSPGHTQVPIWPGAVPDAQPVAGPEFAVTTGKDPLAYYIALRLPGCILSAERLAGSFRLIFYRKISL